MRSWVVVGLVGAVSAAAGYVATKRRRRLPKLLWLQHTELCIVRLPADDSRWPVNAQGSRFFSATRTQHETSLVMESKFAPPPSEGIEIESGWVIFRLEGPLDFDLVGILSRIASTLASHGISIFAVSTYDTDYVMLKAEKQGPATSALVAAGYSFDNEKAVPQRRSRLRTFQACCAGAALAALATALVTMASGRHNGTQTRARALPTRQP